MAGAGMMLLHVSCQRHCAAGHKECETSSWAHVHLHATEQGFGLTFLGLCLSCFFVALCITFASICSLL